MLELFLKNTDDIELFIRKDIPENPKAIVVIVHGLCEHLGRYDYVTDRLVSEGFGVYRFDHRGHGKSLGKKAHYDNYSQIIEDVNLAFKLAKNENEGSKIFLLGHSMGGYAVSLFGIKYPNAADGIITSGGVTRDKQKLFNKDEIKKLEPDTYLKNELSSGVCSDAEIVRIYMEDPLVGKEFTAGLCQSVNDGIAWSEKNSNKFVSPILMLHGCDDALVSEEDSRIFFGDISSTDKALVIYPKLFHEILNEPCKDEILSDITRWLNKRI